MLKQLLNKKIKQDIILNTNEKLSFYKDAFKRVNYLTNNLKD